jgi:hypothetical protein
MPYEENLPQPPTTSPSHPCPAPPLVVHVLVALSADEHAVQEAVRERIRLYTTLPFYARMFADAGLPVAPDGRGLDALASSLVIFGNEDSLRGQLSGLLAQGLDELLVLLVPLRNAAREQAQVMRLIGSID